ncbi:hypothetical protein PR048_007400 [Dryococelus australis]|uniref:Uncharacterized protein n=1 Tax=Dryococelus australis TaxID=614101 RepID=A0ABQ9HV16_9NEOP|nr:hypothetical protein PR048_007400 [Dryococelus australis]
MRSSEPIPSDLGETKIRTVGPGFEPRSYRKFNSCATSLGHIRAGNTQHSAHVGCTVMTFCPVLEGLSKTLCLGPEITVKSKREDNAQKTKTCRASRESPLPLREGEGLFSSVAAAANAVKWLGDSAKCTYIVSKRSSKSHSLRYDGLLRENMNCSLGFNILCTCQKFFFRDVLSCVCAKLLSNFTGAAMIWVNRVQFLLPAGSLLDFRMWESCQTMPLVGGAAPCSPRFSLIDSQDLDVNSHPNLFIHSSLQVHCANKNYNSLYNERLLLVFKELNELDALVWFKVLLEKQSLRLFLKPSLHYLLDLNIRGNPLQSLLLLLQCVVAHASIPLDIHTNAYKDLSAFVLYYFYVALLANSLEVLRPPNRRCRGKHPLSASGSLQNNANVDQIQSPELVPPYHKQGCHRSGKLEKSGNLKNVRVWKKGGNSDQVLGHSPSETKCVGSSHTPSASSGYNQSSCRTPPSLSLRRGISPDLLQHKDSTYPLWNRKPQKPPPPAINGNNVADIGHCSPWGVPFVAGPLEREDTKGRHVGLTPRRQRGHYIRSRLGREQGLTKYSAMAFVKYPSHNSPGVISENNGQLKSGWLDQESNPGPPECESNELRLHHLAQPPSSCSFSTRPRPRSEGAIRAKLARASWAPSPLSAVGSALVYGILKGVHDKMSTSEINLRKKSLPLLAGILTGALSDMRPHVPEVVNALFDVSHHVSLHVLPEVLVGSMHVVVCRRGPGSPHSLTQQLSHTRHSRLRCAVQRASGSWTTEDAVELMCRVHPPPGGVARTQTKALTNLCLTPRERDVTCWLGRGGGGRLTGSTSRPLSYPCLTGSPLIQHAFAIGTFSTTRTLQSPACSGDGALVVRASVTLIAFSSVKKGGKQCRQAAP